MELLTFKKLSEIATIMINNEYNNKLATKNLESTQFKCTKGEIIRWAVLNGYKRVRKQIDKERKYYYYK